MSVLKKLQDMIIAQFSKEEITQLSEFAKPIEVTLKEVKTKDGLKTLSFDGETPAKDMPINDITSGTPVPAEGEYEMEDGTKIKCAAGKIVEVVSPSAETPEQMAARKALETAVPQLAQMSVQMTAQKEAYENTIKDQKKEIVELKKAVQLNSKLLTELLKVEFHALAPRNEKMAYEDMTPLQKVKFNRGEEV